MSGPKLTVMVVGDGGRELALLEKLNESKRVKTLLHWPMKFEPEIADTAKRYSCDLVVIGPEAPLVHGVVDYFAKHAPRIKVFGPSKAAAELEGSKARCKLLCNRYHIPTADYRVIRGRHRYAEEIIASWGAPLVVKADGLMSGKGVRVCATKDQALLFANELLGDDDDGLTTIIIERKLEGQELSVMALCDGKQAMLLEPARDYKRLHADSDEMTGGMGAYSPVPEVSKRTMATIKKKIIDPLLYACREEGHPYHGILYAGIMLTKRGPMLIEVNCRFGDPETQVVLPRLESDLLPYLEACTRYGGLTQLRPLRWKKNAAVSFCIADRNYPKSGKRLRTITGVGATVKAARANALKKVRAIPGIEHYQYRKDIAAGV
jgi:phosphoribosylamine--glycine ligase